MGGACSQWSESADGDWTAFLESCLEDGGTITTVPCPDAGRSGTCTYPAGCTSQTTVLYYGSVEATAASVACQAGGGAFTP